VRRVNATEPLCIALLAGLSVACGGGGGKVTPAGKDELQVTGIVKRATAGSNCWRFVARDGTGYELRPEQAPATLLIEGKAATLVLRPRIDLMSACQAGQIVDVVRVE
jgi:hypothetical protein